MLTRSGVAGTVLIGTAIFGAGGLAWSAVVVFFFVTSSLLSRLSSDRKRRVAADKFDKPNARDLRQTLANGGIGTLAAFAYGANPRRPAWLLGAFVGAFATATADTWATEIGTLSRDRPRLITTGRRVAPGTSGGLTLPGTMASAAGGLALGLAAQIAFKRASPADAPRPAMLAAVGLCAGMVGSLIDSLLGATVQRVNRCPRCQTETERAVHTCGASTVQVRGVPWMDNDAVNLISTAAGALVGTGLWLLGASRARRR
jgi:uncharacterized protein (TIGR00297 family)